MYGNILGSNRNHNNPNNNNGHQAGTAQAGKTIWPLNSIRAEIIHYE